MECITCYVFSCFVAIASVWYYLSGRKLPPGPINIFGSVVKSNGKESAEYILDLKNKYGPVCCIRVLGQPCIYLNTHEKIRQCFVHCGEVTSARLNLVGIKHRLTSGRGLIFNDGESWTAHRRLALSTLRDFGFGKGGAEQIIENELAHLIEDFQKSDGQPVDPRLALSTAAANVIGSLVVGERCGNAPGFRPIVDMVKENAGSPFARLHDFIQIQFIRVMSFVPPSLLPQVMKNFDGVCDFVEEKINNHKKTFNGEVRDVTDAYLLAMQNSDASGTKPDFNEHNLLRTILDLFFAGMETTASTLRWALFLMARYPFVQQHVQAELDEVLQGRMPSTADRKRLPYVDAALMEIQRYVSLSPLGALPHRVSEQFSLDGYTIPKDALLYANLFAAHRDTSVWPHPFEFNPDNFYDAATKSTRNAELLIPFGVGRRSCLGESLAKQELFVLFSGLMQAFEVRPSSDERFPTEDDSLFAQIRILDPFKISFIKR